MPAMKAPHPKIREQRRAVGQAGRPTARCNPKGMTAAWLVVVATLSAAMHLAWGFDILPIFDTNDDDLVKFCKKAPWCKMVQVDTKDPAQTSAAHSAALRAQGLDVVVNMPAAPGTLARQAGDHGQPTPNASAVLKAQVDAAGGDRGKVSWKAFAAEDSARVAFPHDLLAAAPKNYTHAHGLWVDDLHGAMKVAAPWDGVRKWGRVGFAMSTHSLAALGLEAILIERANDDTEDLQTAIAFARGAGAQHSCNWGVDLSLWWGPISGCVGLLDPRFHKRHLYISFFAGAKVIEFEGFDLVFTPNKTLTQLGQVVDSFGEFAMRTDPGQPHASAGVVLPEDHGWITRAYWRTEAASWSYARVPYRQGAAAVDGFFATAFPGSTYTSQ
eukprot:gene4318-4599_t